MSLVVRKVQINFSLAFIPHLRSIGNNEAFSLIVILLKVLWTACAMVQLTSPAPPQGAHLLNCAAGRVCPKFFVIFDVSKPAEWWPEAPSVVGSAVGLPAIAGSISEQTLLEQVKHPVDRLAGEAEMSSDLRD
jgi:hypothetical protein